MRAVLLLAVCLASAAAAVKRCALPNGAQTACPADNALQVAFVVDVTGSMGRYIEDVKNNIERMVNEIIGSNERQLRLELAFVGYRDVGEKSEYLPFTDSVATFKTFVGGVKHSGGGDFPEDVLGGLDAAVGRLRWGEQGSTKMIFHIGDAPHHGTRFEGIAKSAGKPEREKLPRPAESILGEMCTMGIDYYFLRISSSTKHMEIEFQEAYNQGAQKPRQPLQLVDLSSGYDSKKLVSTAVASVEQSLALTLVDLAPARQPLSLRERLTTFYAEHAPEMLDSPKLEAAIERYAGKDEAALSSKLEIKYGTCCPGLSCCAA